MNKIHFDHEKLHVYQDAVKFVAWADPVIEELPAKLAVRDQLDRASTSVVLNIAEGNGRRSHVDRCRYLDIARGSALECAACLDVLVAKRKLETSRTIEGKEVLVGVVSMLVGLIGTFGGFVRENEQAVYGADIGPAAGTKPIAGREHEQE